MQDLLVADPEEAWFVIRDAWAAKSLGILFACFDFWFFSKDPILYIYRLYIYRLYIYRLDIYIYISYPFFQAPRQPLPYLCSKIHSYCDSDDGQNNQ